MAEWTTPTSIHSKCGEEAIFPATKAIDNNTNSRWWHDAACYHWIIFDLEQTYAITKIRIYQYGVAPPRWGQSAGLDVYVSDNPADWGAAVWTGILNSTGWQESGAFSKNGRYVKLVSKSSDAAQKMYEFDAYCAAAAGEGAIPVIMHHYKNMRAA